MGKIMKDKIHAKGIDISIYTTNFENEFISLTDIPPRVIIASSIGLVPTIFKVSPFIASQSFFRLCLSI